jgi:hypothetical protein
MEVKSRGIASSATKASLDKNDRGTNSAFWNELRFINYTHLVKQRIKKGGLLSASIRIAPIFICLKTAVGITDVALQHPPIRDLGYINSKAWRTMERPLVEAEGKDIDGSLPQLLHGREIFDQVSEKSFL